MHTDRQTRRQEDRTDMELRDISNVPHESAPGHPCRRGERDGSTSLDLQTAPDHAVSLLWCPTDKITHIRVLYTRGNRTPGSNVATGLQLAARYRSSFQLTHVRAMLSRSSQQ